MIATKNQLLSVEILRSKEKAERLMCFFEQPEGEWNKEQLAFFKFQLVIEDLRYRKIISPTTEKKIRIAIAPYLYKHILEDPRLENEKIKKIVKESLLNDWLRMCYGKGISIINSKNTT